MATPAAVLSILVKAQGVQATSGQLQTLDKTARKAGAGLATTEQHAKRSTKTFSALGATAKSAGALIGAVGLAAGVKTMVSEFREAQKVGGQTTAVLKSTGNAAKVSKKHIEDLAGSISKKSGIDDEAIQSGENLLLTFTKIRNETGAGNKIFDQATQVITDMSVALGQSGKSSAIQLGKALNDPIKGITALRRVGVSFTADQEKQIKKMVESGDLLGAQKRILKELKTEFGGSAAAQATAGDKLSVSLHNLAEAAGGVLVPALDKAATALTGLINDFIEGKGIAKVIIPAFFQVRDAVASTIPVLASLVDWFKQHKVVTIALVAAIGLLISPFTTLAVAFALAYARSETFRNGVQAVLAVIKSLPGIVSDAFNAMVAEVNKWKVAGAVITAVVAVIKAELTVLAPLFRAAFGVAKAIVTGVFAEIKAVVKGALQVIHGIVQIFGGILKGDFGQIWEGVKNIFRGVGTAIAGILRAQLGVIKAAGSAIGKGIIDGLKAALNLAHELAVAMRDLIAKAPAFALGVGKAIVKGIIAGIKSAASGIGDTIKGALGGAAKLVLPGGEGIGKSAMEALPVASLKGGGSLMGARPSMAPFAAIGAANGLRVSSGLRRGAITSSGNTSYHSTGEAVDLAGPPAGMLATFRQLRSRFGARLAELIYTPGGTGIKNGQPFTYGGQVAKDHFDHVHVAFDTGKPGVGDGFGKARAAFTGDGPGKYSGQQLANLWVKAGGDPKIAGLMARIALAESGGDPSARNPSGATGLWQILGAVVKGNLLDPLVNARNAVKKYKAGGLHPWDASRSAWGKYVGHPGISPSKSARRAGAAAAGKINPYDLAIAQADVAIAGAKGGKIGGVGGRTVSADLAKYGAILAKEKVMGARIRKIRSALKGKLTGPTRLRLTQELAQLIPEHAQLARDRSAILHPAATPTADVSSGDLGAGTDTGDPNQPLIDAINAAAEITRQHDELIKQQIALETTIRDEQRTFANVGNSNYAVLSKAIADVASGQIGGRVGLGFMTPGYSGGGTRY